LIEFEYLKETAVPDIPIIYIAVEVGNKRVGGPALLDTGFDGGIYPNQTLSYFLDPIVSQNSEILEDTSSEIECNVIELNAEIFHPDSDVRKDLGVVKLYLPMDEKNITPDVIVGREILNRLDIQLDGKIVKIE